MTDDREEKVISRSSLVNIVTTVILIAVFAIGAMILITTGMTVYKNVVMASNENFELRTSLSYVATKVRQCDEIGKVGMLKYDDINILVLSEEYQGDYYDTMIYHRDGALCELTQLRGFEPDFEFGFETMQIDDFETELDGNVLTLKATNAEGVSETLRIVLRSGSCMY